jgi:hypothetical protein
MIDTTRSIRVRVIAGAFLLPNGIIAMAQLGCSQIFVFHRELLLTQMQIFDISNILNLVK